MAEFKEFERRFKFKPRLVPLKIVSNVSIFKPALNLNRVLADLNRGVNSLNSISDFLVSYLVKSITSVNGKLFNFFPVLWERIVIIAIGPQPQLGVGVEAMS